MCFDIIFATCPPIYPPAHEIQVVQPQYSAQDLGAPIAIGEKQNLSINFTQSPINLVEALPFNPEALSEENLLNPWMSVKRRQKLKGRGQKVGILEELGLHADKSFVQNSFRPLGQGLYQVGQGRQRTVFFLSETLTDNLTFCPLPSASCLARRAVKFNEIEPNRQIDLVSINSTQSPINLSEPLQLNLETWFEKNSPNPLVSAKFNEIEPNRQIDSVSINPTQSPINLSEPLQFNLETWFEENSPNPGISFKFKEIESKFGQIDPVYTDIQVGSVDIKVGSVKSKLDLDSQDLETELTLLSESGFRFKIKKELQNKDRELKIGPVVSFKKSGFSFKMEGELHNKDRELKIRPVVSFKKSLNWFQEQSKTEPEDKKVSSQQATRFAVLRKLTLNSAYSNSLRINQGNEIDDSSKDIRTLTKSLNSLTTSQLATNTIFSFEGDLEELSAKLEFPVPGILSDELELKIKTNLPEVLVDGEDLQDNMKSTLSLRYGIDINDATKLEIQSSYNLRTMTTTHKIIFELL